jgi:hypothetical protein
MHHCSISRLFRSCITFDKDGNIHPISRLGKPAFLRQLVDAEVIQRVPPQ